VVGKAWTGLIWLRIGTSDGSFVHISHKEFVFSRVVGGGVVFSRVFGGGVLSFHHKKPVSYGVLKTCKLV
jgi:hypothetical protein